MEHTTETAITEQERELVEGFAKLGSEEQVFIFEFMKGLVDGMSPERMTVHQLHEYKKMLEVVELERLFEARPLMRYILAKYSGMSEAYSMAMAYRAGIADGKRLDRQRRAHSAA